MKSKSWVLGLVFVVGSVLAPKAQADIFLDVGDSIVLGGERISCGIAPTPMQSATSRICGQKDYYGQCNYFNESTITGRYCATAEVCGNKDYYGKCTFYNTEAICGDSPCTTSRTCASVDYYGKCNYYNETVSCGG